MYKTGLAVAVLALCACSPKIPDSNPSAGVGFGDYNEYRNASTPPPAAPTVTTVAPPPAGTDGSRATETPTTPGGPTLPVQSTDVQPVPVPTRTSEDAPSIVAFALNTTHPVGTKKYSRSVLGSGAARAQRGCAAFSTAELAQEAFLKAGGPERDKLKIDPDGDGYACAWDPTPFRRING